MSSIKEKQALLRYDHFPFVAVHQSPPLGTAGLRRIYTLYLHSDILYHYHL